jgi:predicted AlkP superfamily phosphohydrolase/phosphomutase
VIRPTSVRWFALAVTALVAAAGCGRAETSGRRVVVLGFDGMDYRVTRTLMANGRMPNFSRLAATGTFSPLRTSIPPQSPVAWSSVITGRHPGVHGIFDFIHRDPSTMLPYLSTTRTEAASRHLTIGSWQFPFRGGRVTLLREGQPFWDVLERHGVSTTIIRMPANFPPSGSARRELSGMGTPDIVGTYGTFSLFTSSPEPSATTTMPGGRVVRVHVVENVVQGEIVGPDHPFRTPARALTAPFAVYIDARENAVRLVAGEEERVIQVGEWTDWVPITFRLMPFQRLHAMSRFYLKQVRPVFQLYASPVNLDPTRPAMPISHPGSYAAELARVTGRFYTQGMPEDTKALGEHVLTRDEFLQQAALAAHEVERQYWTVLDGFADGLLFYYFGNLDQVSHMLWRARDPAHPAYDPAADARYAGVIDDLYVAIDRLVGYTLSRIGPDTTLIVMSDHGFTSWRRAFHLNSWLRDHGYLAIADPNVQADSGLFQNVDWARTRAYGLGLNGLYINLRGRERWGIVEPEDREGLVDEIRRGLLGTIDTATGRAAVARTYPRERIDTDRGHFDIAPDLIIGYADGTRVSNESAVGGLAAGVIVDNTTEWSGDHAMDPDVVPGILLTSRPLKQAAVSLDQVAAAILAEFGMTGSPPVR